MNPELRHAVDRTVDAVNSHQGETCVHVQFDDGAPEIDFLASSARVTNGSFEFSSGFETLSGSVDEIRSIRAEIIAR